MALTPDLLSELIDNANEARRKIEAKIKALQSDLEDANRERDAVMREAEGYRLTAARLFPDAPVADEPQATSLFVAAFAKDLEEGDDFTQMPRTTAVEYAVKALTAGGRPASPADIELFLKEHKRNDNRDQIGGALAHLNRTDKLANVGRGLWVLA